MQTTRTTIVAIGLAAICAAGLNAQKQEGKTTTETKVELKGGTNVTVTGCLEQPQGGDYFLTEVGGSRRLDSWRYLLVTSDDLAKHVGERVEVRGKSVANGKGKVSVESKTKTEVEHGEDLETKTKTEGTAGVLDVPFLGVDSLKVISSSCD